METYSKNCPKCGCIQVYKYKDNFDRAVRLNQTCKSCGKKKIEKLERNCPECGKLLIYKNSSSYCTANTLNAMCKSCRITLYHKQEHIIYKKCERCDIDIIGKNQKKKYCDDCLQILHDECIDNNDYPTYAYLIKNSKELGILKEDIRKFGVKFLKENKDLLESLQIINTIRNIVKDSPKEKPDKELYTKTCPICGRIQKYYDQWTLNRAIKSDSKCNKCV